MGITPTTKAQVSGHKFLLRRMEHGLVLGDIRMIHDPFAKRSRALIFGIAACALLAVGAVALAVFTPATDPGTAAIIQSDSGQLYVRVDDVLHPVANLASARLIAGEAAEPKPASDVLVRELPKAQTVGIIDAPGIFAPAKNPDGQLNAHVCQNTTTPEQNQQVTVLIQPVDQLDKFHPLNADRGIIAITDNTEWLITADGRRKLPADDSPDGRMLRRHFAIDPLTPRWQVTPQLLSAVTELPEIHIPPEVEQVISVKQVAGESFWARTKTGVVALSVLQANVLIDAGRPLLPGSAAELNVMPDASPKQLMSLPESVPQWLDPMTQQVCINNDGKVVMTAPFWTEPVSLAANEAVATHFSGPGWAIGVETGQGVHVISATGLRHQLESPETLTVVGLTETHFINWDILRLLPSGTTLGREEALQPVVQ